MNVIQKHIDYLDKSIKTIREIIDSIIAPYESAINLICSIPGKVKINNIRPVILFAIVCGNTNFL